MRSPACLDDRAAYGLAMGTLDPQLSSAAREHIDTCDSCRDLVAAVAVGAEQPPPETIGRYEIVGVLGSGAMGIVYEARDPQLERRVAIKVLRGETHRERLLREARAAAQISHPNVIAVFDAGIADGEVFMAMELIRGRTLRQWLDDKPRTWREVLAVAIQAGRGIAGLHSADLVHRDIKPDNVLVADDGRIVVTDLGLVRLEPTRDAADATKPLSLTQTGAMVGTPAYAAPEQLDGPTETDARSDQFSYCVTVYEALAGKRPFEGQSLITLREAIDRGPADLVGERLKGLPASVKAAIWRGLSPVPAARWPSVDALVRELERVLAPRSRKWLPAAIGAAAIAAIAVIATVTLFPTATKSRARYDNCDSGRSEVARVWNDKVRAELADAFAKSGVSYAPETWTRVAKLVDAYGERIAAGIDDACSATKIKRIRPQAVMDVRIECFARRSRELGVLLDVLRKPDATQIDLAPSAVTGLLSPDWCWHPDLLQATEPVPDAPEQRKRVTDARETLARVDALDASGKTKEAIALAREVSQTAQAIGYAPLIAEADKELGRIAIDLQEWDEAKQALGRASLAAERGRHHVIRADVELARAYMSMQRNKLEEAVTELGLAEAVVIGLGGNERNQARVEDYRATVLAKLGKLDEANTAGMRALGLYEKAEGPQTISLANPLTQLAYVAYQRNDLPAAIGHLQRALDVQLAAFGPDHPRIGHARTNLAFNLGFVDKLDEAQKEAEAARAIYEKSLGVDSIPYGEASRALLGILQRKGDAAAAEKIAKAVVDRLAKRKDTDPERYATAMEDLAASIMAQQRVDEALKLHQEVLAIRQKAYPATHPSVVSSQTNVGDVLADLGRCKEALPLYESAQRGADAPDVPPYMPIAARIGRGRCLVETKQAAAAVAPLREALALNKDPQAGDDRRLRAQTRFVLAQALVATKQKAEAKQLADAAAKEADAIGIKPLADGIRAWAKTAF